MSRPRNGSSEGYLFADNFEAAALDFIGVGPEYINLSAQARAMYDAGREDALYMMAVKFTLDVTLDTLALPGIAKHLATEVAHRADQARRTAHTVVQLAIENDVFALAYGNNPYTADVPAIPEDLTDDEASVLLDLPTTIFPDVQVPVGGALRVLKHGGVNSNPAAAISRSPSLRLVAGIHRDPDNAAAASEFLGWPYAYEDLYELQVSPTGPTPAFTQEAQDRLRQFFVPGGGCPARGVTAIDSWDPQRRLLDQYWEQTVGFLVPPEATADYENEA